MKTKSPAYSLPIAEKFKILREMSRKCENCGSSDTTIRFDYIHHPRRRYWNICIETPFRLCKKCDHSSLYNEKRKELK